MPSPTSANLSMPPTFPAPWLGSEQCSQLSIISVQNKPAPSWRLRWPVERASECLNCAQRTPLMLLGVLPTPLRVLIATPFIRPFRWSRLFWTYVVPALPLVLLFDSVVSVLRLYSVDELRGLTVGLKGYDWDIGRVRYKKLPIAVTYLIGIPASNGPSVVR